MRTIPMAAVALVAVMGCCGCRFGANPAFAAAHEFVRVEQAHRRLEQAAAALARCSQETKAPNGSAEARPSSALANAQRGFEVAWIRSQRTTAAFLSRALRAAPNAPEIARALEFVASDAVEVATLVRATTKDTQAALRMLRSAERTFVSMGRPVPAELARALATGGPVD